MSGRIVWHDLTVPDADKIQQFYSEVIGWQSRLHDMGDYHDFDMQSPGSEENITGVCHARGSNANLPPQWLIYVEVEDVSGSARRCEALGGTVVDGPRPMGLSQFCVIQDPAGAVIALIEKSPLPGA